VKTTMRKEAGSFVKKKSLYNNFITVCTFNKDDSLNRLGSSHCPSPNTPVMCVCGLSTFNDEQRLQHVSLPIFVKIFPQIDPVFPESSTKLVGKAIVLSSHRPSLVGKGVS
jgi:hypothetical protein